MEVKNKFGHTKSLMTEGPPSSEATSSKTSAHPGVPYGPPNYTPWYTTSYAQLAATGSSTPTAPGFYQPYLQTGNPYAAHYGPHSYYPQYQSQPTTYVSRPIQPFPTSNLKQTQKPPSPSPSPSPPPPDPETYKHWDVVIRAFLLKTGLTQALKGFEADMLVLNPEWEQLKIPQALEEIIKGLTAIKECRAPKTGAENGDTGEGQKDTMQVDVPSQPTTSLQSKYEESLETRKLAYVHLANGAQPRSQSSINKSISLFLAQNQARNDASNRAEFLSSLAERKKRQRVEETEGSDPSTSNEAVESDIIGKEIGTCARVDAKPIDRGAQMKYDIAKDDCGPLSRTAKAGLYGEKGKTKSSPLEAEVMEIKPTIGMTTIKKEIDDEAASIHHPGLDERLKNIEDHIAVRFVPNPPRTLLARLKFLEDHLINLEKEYPPWAALHFKQPGRGWPPPPRTTPIIVPPHLRDTGIETLIDKPSKTKTKGKSSLHRAVMEKLEVQRAMLDIT